MRENVFGETATDSVGREFAVVTYPLNELQLEAGGFERRGAIRAIMAEDVALPIHSVATLRGKKWRVVSITESKAFGEVSQNWEPLP